MNQSEFRRECLDAALSGRNPEERHADAPRGRNPFAPDRLRLEAAAETAWERGGYTWEVFSYCVRRDPDGAQLAAESEFLALVKFLSKGSRIEMLRFYSMTEHLEAEKDMAKKLLNSTAQSWEGLVNFANAIVKVEQSKTPAALDAAVNAFDKTLVWEWAVESLWARTTGDIATMYEHFTEAKTRKGKPCTGDKLHERLNAAINRLKLYRAPWQLEADSGSS